MGAGTGVCGELRGGANIGATSYSSVAGAPKSGISSESGAQGARAAACAAAGGGAACGAAGGGGVGAATEGGGVCSAAVGGAGCTAAGDGGVCTAPRGGPPAAKAGHVAPPSGALGAPLRA